MGKVAGWKLHEQIEEQVPDTEDGSKESEIRPLEVVGPVECRGCCHGSSWW